MFTPPIRVLAVCVLSLSSWNLAAEPANPLGETAKDERQSRESSEPTEPGRTIRIDMNEMRRDFDKAAELYNKQQYAEALPIFQRLGDLGHVESAYMSGLMHDRGRGTAGDGTQASKYYEKAAKAGHAAAQCNLGILYREGKGVEKDLAKAAEWLGKGARGGNAPAQLAYGAMLFNGQGVEKNLIDAAAWWQLAAEQKDAMAARNLEVVNRQLSDEQKQQAQQRAAALKQEMAAGRP